MFLDATTRKLQVVLDAAMTTNNCPVAADWVDFTATTTTLGNTPSNTNGTTPVDFVAAPGASTQRKINGISVYNADTVAVTVTVRFNDNGTPYTIVKVLLAVGYTLTYTDAAGWATLDTAARFVGPAGPTGPTGPADPLGSMYAAAFYGAP